VLQLVVGFGEAATHEGHADLVRTCRGNETNVLGAGIDVVHGRPLIQVKGCAILVTPEDGLVDLFAVDCDDHPVFELDVVHPRVEVEVAHADGVLAVGRKLVLDEHAAAGAERQSFDVELLVATAFGPCRQRLVWLVHLAAQGRDRIADHLFADDPSRRHVLVDEGWGHTERLRHVVEALAGGILRQQVGGRDGQTEQITDRRGVFLAIEAVDRHVGGVLAALAGLVEIGFQPANEGIGAFFVGSRVVGWRHHAAAQLHQDLFE